LMSEGRAGSLMEAITPHDARHARVLKGWRERCAASGAATGFCCAGALQERPAVITGMRLARTGQVTAVRRTWTGTWKTRHARGIEPSGGRGRSRHPFGTGTSVEGTRQVTTATPLCSSSSRGRSGARSPREPIVETATPSTVKAAYAAHAARPPIGRPLRRAVDGARFGGRAHLAWQWSGSPASARG
jgi:hypothetical protein